MFEYWPEFCTCTSCGKECMGIEFWDEEMKEQDISVHICRDCVKKMLKRKGFWKWLFLRLA